MRRAALGATIGLVALVLGVAAPPAGATDGSKVKACKLLTKKEATRILGAKVVRTELQRSTAKQVAECRFKSTKFIDADYRDLQAPLQLKVTVQTLTSDLRAELDAARDEDLPPIGDDAFRTNTGQAISYVGDLVVEVNYQNAGPTPSDVSIAKQTAMLQLVVPRLERIVTART